MMLLFITDCLSLSNDACCFGDLMPVVFLSVKDVRASGSYTQLHETKRLQAAKEQQNVCTVHMLLE